MFQGVGCRRAIATQRRQAKANTSDVGAQVVLYRSPLEGVCGHKVFSCAYERACCCISGRVGIITWIVFDTSGSFVGGIMEDRGMMVEG